MSRYNIHPCQHPLQSPVVQSCCDARNRAIQSTRQLEMKRLLSLAHNAAETPESILSRVDKGLQHEAGALAYAAAMPTLSCRKDVKDFIACVVHAMALGVLDPDHGSRLLYGARTASITMGRKRKSASRNAAPQAGAQDPIEEIEEPA